MSLVIRDLQKADYGPSWFALLSQLTEAPLLSLEEFEGIFESRQEQGNQTFVAEVEGQLAGTLSLLVEPKFIRGGRMVGHLEDVVVDPRYRGQRVGQALLEHVKQVAQSRGCYKLILDCDLQVEGFYEKAGFTRKGVEMRLDFPSET